MIDKPYTWTSFDVINKLRKSLHVKIGHAGTLDPLATGLLICCTGSYTKQIETYQKQIKEYTGVFCLGATTPTYDLESEPTDFKSIEDISEENILQASKLFIGEILQTPPAHSAIKKDGKRAYELARAGKEVVLQKRPIVINEFEIINIALPDVHFRVVCSTGTYIRSLANDFGQELNCGAYLKSLVRTRIGDFRLEEAKSLEQWLLDINNMKGKSE